MAFHSQATFLNSLLPLHLRKSLLALRWTMALCQPVKEEREKVCVCVCVCLWGQGTLIQLMSTFPVFIFFRCSVAFICLLHATLFTQFDITNLGLPLMEDMCVHCIEASFVFMPEIQSGIALGMDWGRRNREECVCVRACMHTTISRHL